MEGVSFNFLPEGLIAGLSNLLTTNEVKILPNEYNQPLNKKLEKSDVFSELMACVLLELAAMLPQTANMNLSGWARIDLSSFPRTPNGVLPNGIKVDDKEKLHYLEEILEQPLFLSEEIVEEQKGLDSINRTLQSEVARVMSILEKITELGKSKPLITLSGNFSSNLERLLRSELNEAVFENIESCPLGVLMDNEKVDRMERKVEEVIRASTDHFFLKGEGKNVMISPEGSIKKIVYEDLPTYFSDLVPEGEEVKLENSEMERTKVISNNQAGDDEIMSLIFGVEGRGSLKEDIDGVDTNILRLQDLAGEISTKDGTMTKLKEIKLDNPCEKYLIYDFLGRGNEEVLRVDDKLEASVKPLRNLHFLTDYEREIFDKIVETIRFIKDGEIKSVFVKLKPEYLGTLALKVSHFAGEVRVKMSASTQEAQRLLLGHITQLKDYLRQDGIPVQDVQIVYSGMWSDSMSLGSGMNLHERNRREQVHLVTPIAEGSNKSNTEHSENKNYYCGKINYWA